MKFNTLGDAITVQASQRGKQLLGKKNLNLGTEYLLMFPKKDNQLVVSGIVGRSASYDNLGLSFVRIAPHQMHENPETGAITDKSGLSKYAMASTVLYKASEAMEKEAAKDQAELIAKKTGTALDEVSLNRDLEAIEVAYRGKKAEGSSKSVAPTRQRLLSPSIDFSIFTEAVLIPLNKELKPIFEQAKEVEVRLSPTKQRQLQAAVTNTEYNDFNDPDGFLEIKFSYIGDSAQEAGKKDYVSVEVKHRKVNLAKDENGNYVDSGTKIIQGHLNNTAHDSDIIFNRSSTVKFATPAEEFEAAFRKYCSTKAALTVGYVDFEDESLKRNAKDLLELGCLFKAGSKQYLQLQEVIENNSENTTVEEDGLLAGTLEMAQATTVDQTVSAMDANQALQELVYGEDSGREFPDTL